VSAQGVTDAGALNALLAEVRLLRQAIERQSAVTGRAQLLVGKLALQDQRVMRWQSEAARLESEAAGLGQRRVVNQARLTELRHEIQNDRDPERAQALEREARRLETQVKQEAAQHAMLETRRAEAAQALDAERSRYDELSDRLERLERELDKPGR
jgi:chromosome segregation ATPase